MRFFGAEQGHRRTVSEYRANTRFPERVDSGISVGRRIDDVAPVEQRGYAGIDLIKRSHQIADVHVLRRIEAHDPANQHAKVMVERPIRGDAAQRGLPQVDMPVDKARHGDHAAAIDFVYGPAAKVWADRDDLAAINEKVARFDDPERGIHRHDRGALHAYSRQHEPYPAACLSRPRNRAAETFVTASY